MLCWWTVFYFSYSLLQWSNDDLENTKMAFENQSPLWVLMSFKRASLQYQRYSRLVLKWPQEKRSGSNYLWQYSVSVMTSFWGPPIPDSSWIVIQVHREKRLCKASEHVQTKSKSRGRRWEMCPTLCLVFNLRNGLTFIKHIQTPKGRD